MSFDKNRTNDHVIRGAIYEVVGIAAVTVLGIHLSLGWWTILVALAFWALNGTAYDSDGNA